MKINVYLLVIWKTNKEISLIKLSFYKFIIDYSIKMRLRWSWTQNIFGWMVLMIHETFKQYFKVKIRDMHQDLDPSAPQS